MDKEPPLGVSWSAWAPPRSHLAATPQEDISGWAEEGKASPSIGSPFPCKVDPRPLFREGRPPVTSATSPPFSSYLGQEGN